MGKQIILKKRGPAEKNGEEEWRDTNKKKCKRKRSEDGAMRRPKSKRGSDRRVAVGVSVAAPRRFIKRHNSIGCVEKAYRETELLPHVEV